MDQFLSAAIDLLSERQRQLKVYTPSTTMPKLRVSSAEPLRRMPSPALLPFMKTTRHAPRSGTIATSRASIASGPGTGRPGNLKIGAMI